MFLRRVLFLVLISGSVSVHAAVTSPKQFFGFDVCDDYQLANYQQLTKYWQTLAKESNRIKIVSIGKTEEGREQYMALISDPANLRNAEKIRKTSERIAKAKDFKDEAEFQKVARSAKTVIWIDGGLHANETLGAQQLIETAYQLVSRNDDENRRILKDSMILLVHANPDGMDLVSDWYMRRSRPSDRSLANIPVLYEKYAGHDNNRDFFQMNTAEVRNMNRVLYREWFPQVVYNHHQSSPAGTIMFVPPFRNPFNYHVDPLVNNATDLVGTHMQHRLIGQGLAGTVSQDGASFSAWWNGGLRTTTYFHNMVGILTETWGSPNPGMLPFVTERQVPTTDSPKPIDVRTWHLKDSLQYEIEANYAILDYASRYRDRLLYSVYRAAKNSVERGSKDTWSRYPSRIRSMGAEALSKPELRDARYYVIPPDQHDTSATRQFIKILVGAGVEVHISTKDQFGVPKGSYVVKCDQAYRPHVLDMFEPQDHPNDLQYPGGPPKAPYDNAGYTPAYTMGVKFVRVLEDRSDLDLQLFQGGSEVTDGRPLETFLMPFNENESFKVANIALQAKYDVSTTDKGFLFKLNKDQVTQVFQAIPDAVSMMSADRSPDYRDAKPLKMPRIALLDRFGGSMPSGWMRWLFDNFAYKYDVVFPPDIDKGSLRDKYDVIVLPSGLVSRSDSARRDESNPIDDDPTVPAQYKGRWGSISDARSIPALRQFVEQGGHLIALGTSSSNIAKRLKLPVEDALVDAKTGVGYKNSEFYIPGSVLRVRVDAHELTRGMTSELDVLFDDSPAFNVKEGAIAFGRFDTAKPLRSGWALGQEKLNGSSVFVDVSLGSGRVVLYSPEVNFRGQTHASFKLIFNAIERSAR